MAGEASEASFGDPSTDPLVHVSETMTTPGTSGMKFLLTMNVVELGVFVIVQPAGPASMATFWQLSLSA
jgi:hypothetical protein